MIQDEDQTWAGIEAPDFFLKHLHIENFRLLKDIDLEFEPTLNVIIGRNNDGKSALIDALRLLFNTGTYEEMDDFIRFSHKDPCRIDEEKDELDIVIEATFYGRNGSDAESIFAEIGTDDDAPEIPDYGVYKLKIVASYVFDQDKQRYKRKTKVVSGGKDFAHPVNVKTLDYMKAIYLDALRDITRDYKRVGFEIERLLYAHGDPKKLKLIPKTTKDAVLSSVSRATDENQHEKEARTKFAKYAAPYGYDGEKDFLKFSPTNLNDEMLRQLGAEFSYGVRGTDTVALGLGSNGMGINNLIYASIVLSRSKEDDAISRFFLIEEPEAHLHPQLQDSFFSELNSVKKQQLFVTSHSPTIVAKANLEKIIVLRDDHTTTTGTKPIMLRDIGSPDDRKYLHKFLDVTRSQFLFANAVIFVEGVTEGMLMQRFSEIMGSAYDLRANGVEIVVLDAKYGYEHFRNIVGQDGLDIRSVRLGDDDREPSKLPEDAGELKKLCQQSRKITNRQVEIDGVGTFELELLVAASLATDKSAVELLQEAARGARAGEDVTSTNYADDFVDTADPILAYRKMKQSSNDKDSEKRYVLDEAHWRGKARTNSQFVATKSEYAYNIYQALLDEDKARAFIIPQYIQDAIKHVTMKDKEADGSNQ